MTPHQSLQPERWDSSSSPLVALFRHNLWANLRLFDACMALDQAELAATMVGTYGTIYDTLRHLVQAEQNYLRRLTGHQPVALFGRDETPDLATLRDLIRHSGEGLIEVAATISPTDGVVVPWDDGRQVPILSSLLLTQAINHATEHRTQVTAILTQEGIEPPDMSGWGYVEEFILPTIGD